MNVCPRLPLFTKLNPRLVMRDEVQVREELRSE